MSNNDREKTFSFNQLLREFNQLEGYCNLNNDELASQLKKLNLLEENVNAENKIHDPETIAIYKQWSFTVSFLQMLNWKYWAVCHNIPNVTKVDLVNLSSKYGYKNNLKTENEKLPHNLKKYFR